MLFLLHVLFSVYAQKEENDLQIIIDTNIEQFLSKNTISLLFFYTPQCGHCERFQPEVEKAAKYLKDEAITVAKVDGHNYKEIAKRFQVNGFPTVLLLQDNGAKYTKFEGPRTSDTIILWMYEQINTGSKLLSSLQEITEAINQNDCLFLYIAPDENDRSFKRFKEFSHFYADVSFVHTFLPVQNELKLGDSSFVAFKKYDKSPVSFQSKSFKVQELKAFVESNIYKKLAPYNEEFKKKIFKQDRSAILLFVEEQQTKSLNAIDAVMKIALAYPPEEQLLFVSVSTTNELYQEVTAHLGVHQEIPFLLGVSKNGVYKYKFTKSFTNSNLEQFLGEMKQNKAPRHYKSQKLETTAYSEYVTILNGNSYVQQVFNGGEWVVLYYNSFDIKQSKILEDFNEVAKTITKISKIRFAIINIALNEVNEFNEQAEIVKIRLYKGEKDFNKFTLIANTLQKDRLSKFIKENSNYEFNEEQAQNNRHDDL